MTAAIHKHDEDGIHTVTVFGDPALYAAESNWTLVPPLPVDEYEVNRMKADGQWEVIPDFRGVVFHDPITGKPFALSEAGATPPVGSVMGYESTPPTPSDTLLQSGEVWFWDGSAWVARPRDGFIISAPVEKSPEQILAELIADLDRFLDAKAAERRYDNRITCALRAGYPGPYRAEGTAYATWMDSCYRIGTARLNAVLAGTATVPTTQELLALMPVFVWPELEG